MNRYFISDKESDILITVATKVFGLKIGDIINMAIKNEFLPMTEPFRTEATFILQCRAENKLDAWEIKQSMTRGIRALGTRPVYDADRLQGFFARYHLHEDTENCTITENDALWESAVEVYTLIAEEKLKPDETRKFVDNSFRDGILKTTGTDVDRILPPVSRFGGGNRAAKKDGIIAKLQAFFDKYFGLV